LKQHPAPKNSSLHSEFFDPPQGAGGEVRLYFAAFTADSLKGNSGNVPLRSMLRLGGWGTLLLSP
jgi:hypothetical protein